MTAVWEQGAKEYRWLVSQARDATTPEEKEKVKQKLVRWIKAHPDSAKALLLATLTGKDDILVKRKKSLVNGRWV